jgi:tetratricopeptide (TPR) repeat protein
VIAGAPGNRAGAEASAGQLLAQADEAWARRGEPERAAAAEELYLRAASADERGVEGLLGAMRAKAFRVERERDAATRTGLAQSAVDLGQWCERRDPGNSACAYGLAIALGQQARERPSTAKDGLARMTALLRRAIAADPRLDHGGPHRVLALVLLRAPGWPVGPGDPDEALGEARAAAALFPDAADNALVLAEALARTGHRDEARAAYERARALAERARAASDPDAERWLAEARAGLRG